MVVPQGTLGSRQLYQVCTLRSKMSLLTFGQRSSVQLFSSMKSRSSVQLAGKAACTWLVFSNQKLHIGEKRREREA